MGWSEHEEARGSSVGTEWSGSLHSSGLPEEGLSSLSRGKRGEGPNDLFWNVI